MEHRKDAKLKLFGQRHAFGTKRKGEKRDVKGRVSIPCALKPKQENGQENGPPNTHKRTRTDFKLGEDMGIDLNEHISELQHPGINGSEDTTKRQISLSKSL